MAENKGLLHGIKVTPDCPPISHLFFADDWLIFLNAKYNEARLLHDIIGKFNLLILRNRGWRLALKPIIELKMTLLIS